MALTSLARPATTPSGAASRRTPDLTTGTADSRRGNGWWRAAGLFLGGLAVFAVALAWRFPRFFYIDDKQLQYLPVFRWLGQMSDGLAPPLIDPDQGMAGNFAADPQYGVFDPFHWLVYRVVLATDDLSTASWMISLLSLVVLGLGMCAVATEHQVKPVWAAAAALGGATSGWLLFVGASWWPMTWGTALLPWLWWGVAARSRWGAPAAALSAYLLVSSGYPYALPFAGVVVLAVVADRLVHEGNLTGGALGVMRHVLARRSAGPLLAAAGGALAGSCNLWVARELQGVTQRAGGESPPLGNAGNFVPNLLDTLLGGSTLFGQAEGWWGTLLPVPVMATAWFAVPLLALAPWRAALRTRGVTAALALTAFSALATQTTTEIGSFRFPVRYLADLGVFLPLLTVLLLRQGWVLGRGRLLLAAGLVGAQLALAFSRAPALGGWHLLGAVAVLGCLGVVVVGERSALRRPGRVFVAAVLLLGVALLPQVGARAAVDGERMRPGDPAAALPQVDAGGAVSGERMRSQDPAAGLPLLGAHDSTRWPALVSEFEDRAWEPGLDATVLAWGGAGPDLGLGSGVLLGSANLFSGTTTGFGYTSVGQRAWADRWCADYLGQVGTCPQAEQRLMETAPGTELTWLEVMAKDQVLVSDSTPLSLRDRLVDSGRWEPAERVGVYTRLTRTDPRPGRATWNNAGVRALEPVDVGSASQAYDVSVDAAAAQRVVFRDTWWPGYQATLDGVEVPTSSFDGTVVQVELPEGSYSGRLVLAYRPAGLGAGLASVAVGLVLAVAGVLLGVLPRRRPARRPGARTDHGGPVAGRPLPSGVF